MVRSAERATIGERAIGQFAGNRLDHRDIKQFAGAQRRQDGGEPRCQHGFAGAWRAYHKHRWATAEWLMSAWRPISLI
jgi:hypothetical protein